MSELQGSLKMITDGSVLLYLLKGLGFTVLIAVFAVALGLVIGSVLAIARNYCTDKKTVIFKWLATAYIEIFRNTPLMLWMFIGLVYFPSVDVSSGISKALGLSRTEIALLIKGVIALVLFTSSVIAEIVRGGLNSIPKGQFEAAYSQGFGFVKTLLYIVLPQTFRNIIPTLLSQVITTVKDTSYIANIAIAELLGRTFQIIQISPRYTGFTSQNVSDVFVLCGLACVMYFIINFTLSCVVRRMQKPKVRKQAAAQ
ncbi:MAG: amino acid ABC transporter permease [Lachnospiraceae bacterium]|nr:amino acid ABC transporter permease [Ruminococcus sp.]MCM1275904.1 amino acid ABC transporter permease [Lachnospiraceae bacterium]